MTDSDSDGPEESPTKMKDQESMMAQMANLLDDRLKSIASKENINQIVEKVKLNTDAVNELKKSISQNADEIQSVKLTVARLERESIRDDDRMEEQLRRGNGDILKTPFFRSRCSIRIWPIKGRSEQELTKEVGLFCREALGVTEAEQSDLEIKGIRRVRSAPASKVHNEVLVTFADPDQRDFIFSKGNMLSEFISDGKPTAGMRMDIPANLVDTHKLLNDLGYQIKRRFGSSTRKYVKFDSANEDLFLEVRLPDSYNWLRITPQMAREMKSKYDEKEIQLLNIPTSTSRPQPPTSQQTRGRTPRTDSSGVFTRSWKPATHDDFV